MDRNYGDDLTFSDGVVALRKESVDRNTLMCEGASMEPSRSPQGERG